MDAPPTHLRRDRVRMADQPSLLALTGRYTHSKNSDS